MIPTPVPAYTTPMADARLEENHSEIKNTCGTMPAKVKPTARIKPKQMYNCHKSVTRLLR
ncbi:MAG TPA: hypothetical protein VGK57_10060 [Candidatus Binatia bacterium]